MTSFSSIPRLMIPFSKGTVSGDLSPDWINSFMAKVRMFSRSTSSNLFLALICIPISKVFLAKTALLSNGAFDSPKASTAFILILRSGFVVRIFVSASDGSSTMTLIAPFAISFT